jgi:SAGA-associated factor 29
MIESENGESDLLNKMEILAALRDAQEPDPVPTSRSTSVGKSQRDRQNKRKLTDTIDDRENVAADSPGGHSSPKVVVPNKDRLKVMSGGSRAGSVPAGREDSVKAEDTQDDAKGKKKRSSSSVASSRKSGSHRVTKPS